jgi:hypothetical protein
MATSVNEAFDDFIREEVNLDPDITSLARSSRDWLIAQIHGFGRSVADFPLLYSEKDVLYGSFARNTKIRELDDIDLMICLHAQGGYYTEDHDHIEVTVPDQAAGLYALCNDYTNILNSRRVINKFVSTLQNVPQYDKAEVHRSQEAATLKLKSYTWCFDIVPCFFTTVDSAGKNYYLIPDGNGHWKKTDPRQDAKAVALVNQHHSGRVLNPARVVKFWNRRSTAPSMSSYLVETIIVAYYLLSKADGTTSLYIDLELPDLFRHIATAVFDPVYDLKEIQGDINILSFDERLKIQQRANLDYSRALEARSAEGAGNQRGSISKWGEIFGPRFPSYG